MKQGLRLVSNRALLVAALGLSLPLATAYAQSVGGSGTDSSGGATSSQSTGGSGSQFNDSQMAPGQTPGDTTTGSSGSSDSGAQGPIRSDTNSDEMRNRSNELEMRRDRDSGSSTTPSDSTTGGSSNSGTESGSQSDRPFWRNNPR